MDSDRMARLDELLEAAIELKGEERGEFLARLDDGQLRHDLARLLDYAEQRESRSPGNAPSEPETQEYLGRLGSWVRDIASREVVPDSRIGAYRLAEQIGSGGMGVVYRAERADGSFEQRVALKLLPAGVLSADAIHLFEQERQILARLSHENIARLLDGGVDSLGRPFLAMECVDGLPIDQYCDRHRLDLRARLLLFAAVCRAVQYAHQNLVVHRDLKPGNILVTHEGVVKLLDFGIASVLESTSGGPAAEGERLSRRRLSPSYASPEQFAGKAVTTASDVYSLGVVLFQLVTGRLPYALAEPAESPRPNVMRGEAPLASAALAEEPSRADLLSTSPSRLRRQVAGDFDAIVAKALANDPARRYPSAQQFGDDARHWVEGLPVMARGTSPRYLLHKWVTRHAVVSLVATLAMVGISLALIATLWQAREATRARSEAESKAAVARRISEVLVEVFERAKTDPAGEKAIVETLLDPASARIGVELEDSPEVQAALMDALGRAYQRLGRYVAARSLAEQALVIRRQLHPEPHREVAMSERLLGSLLAAFGEIERAAEILRDSVETLRLVASDEPLEIARGETLLSHALGTLGDDAGSEFLRRRSLESYRRELGEDHPRVAQALDNLGGVLVRRGAAIEAEPLFLRALEIYRGTAGDQRLAMVGILGDLAHGRLEAGRLVEAEAAARETVEVGLQVYGPAHPHLAHGFDLLARVLVARGAFVEAKPWAIKALEVYSRGNPGGRTRTALMHGTLLQIALFEDDLTEAAHQLQGAQELMVQITPPGHLVQAMVRSYAGRLRAAEGRDAEALAALESAFQELRHRQAPASLALRQTALALVELYTALGDEAAAERLRGWCLPPPSS